MSVFNLKKDNKDLTDNFAENLIQIGHEVYANTPSKTDRSECFSQQKINQIISSGKLPDEILLEHLFNCSDCFQLYKFELSKNKSKTESEILNSFPFFSLRRFKWQLIYLGLTGLLFFGLIWAFLLQITKPIEIVENKVNIKEIDTYKDTNIINEKSQDNVNSDKSNNQKNSESNDIQPKVNNQKNRIVPKSNVIRYINEQSKVETKDFSTNVILKVTESKVLRSNNSASDTDVLILPAKKINLTLKLPNYYENGVYKFELIDIESNILFTRKIKVNNSYVSIKTIDLIKLKKSASKFCLQKDADIPDCFSIQLK